MSAEPDADPLELDTWKDLGLHHWICLARRYGVQRPFKLKRSVIELSAAERAEWMRRTLEINEGQEVILVDRWDNTVVVNERIVEKTLNKGADRTPYVAWLRFALANAIEVWEKPVNAGGELRRYYLAAITAPEKLGILVIVGQDGVAFNVFKFDASYAEQLRAGELVHAAYASGAIYCSHGCCDDVVTLERELDVARRERTEALERLRAERKKKANPPK